MTEQKKNISQTTFKKPKSWRKVESSTFFRFENIGNSLEGLLIEKMPYLDGDKMRFYRIRTFDNKELKFHGSNQLDDLLSQFQPPVYVRITYADEQDTKNGMMKLFEVETGEN